MYVEKFLRKNDKLKASVGGTNVYLGKGELVQVTCRPSGHVYMLRRGDQIQLPSGLTYEAIEVVNMGVDSEISLVCIEGKFFPTLDGSKISVAADLEAENLEVRFEGRQPVELLPTQQVKAEVSNFPEQMKVEVLNAQSVPEVQKVHVVEQTAPNLRYVAHETMTATGIISGNTKRKELILKAGANNQASIWLGGIAERGFELAPDGGFILSNGAELEVLIPDNCQLYVSEVTA